MTSLDQRPDPYPAPRPDDADDAPAASPVPDPFPVPDLDERRARLVAQTDLLRATARGADPATPVPSCAGWDLGMLLRHVGGTHRWAETVVRTRATGPVPHDAVDDVSADGAHPGLTGGDALDAWLEAGAAAFGDALGAAGPDAPVWTVAPGGTPVFWARRMTAETALHRWDAADALALAWDLDPAVAYDALAEWLEFSVLPQAYASEAEQRELLADGRTLHFAATDADAGLTVDLSGDAPTWRRTGGAAPAASVTVRGPLPALLLCVYGRRESPRTYAGEAEVLGDAALFRDWRHRASAWLRR
ncbi:maleylpyruvate isomerase N-terminal domain-containing protein [Streptomyces phytohabitans]|uniref:maleylpyruvate isomerase N-terminal domain-containing protein n=1 Tax=Streptomyces phytohabitans TaxID=1150371 RepID=UPI00345B8DAC